MRRILAALRRFGGAHSTRPRCARGPCLSRGLTLESLESRTVFTTVSGAPAFADFVLSEVVNRAVFYNNSQFDGRSSAADFRDDTAIASDKSALLPGGPASFQNYTSYSRGLNGLMVDIEGLPDTPTLVDFHFQFAAAGSSTWQDLAHQPQMLFRKGAGLSGADRLEFVWSDADAVHNGWLKVTVADSARTGLQAPDVFYFGNAIGETGNLSGRTTVNASDEIEARNHPATFVSSVGVTDRYDFNRDGLVNATDQILARSNATRVTNELVLMATPPAPAIAAKGDPDGFDPLADGYFAEYSPAIVKSTNGTLLMFFEGRMSYSDSSTRDLLMRRSFDNGATWTNDVVLVSEPQFPNERISSPSPVVDQVTGTIILMYTRSVNQVFVIRSSNDGATWSVPQDITTTVKYVSPTMPGGVDYGPYPFSLYATGPGNGIQLQHGAHSGRLIITANHRLSNYSMNLSWSNIIYSDDHGVTWHLGGGMTHAGNIEPYTNEAEIVELANGDLYLNMRVQGAPTNFRASSISHDGGMTWTPAKQELALTTPSVDGSMIRINDHVIAFAAPSNAQDSTRRQMTIWLSYDEAQTWIKSKTVYFSYAGYSDMTLVGPDTVMLAFNSGRTQNSNAWFQSISLARFNLHWLETPQPYEFEWNFNDGPIGSLAQFDQPYLADDGPWDLRAMVKSGGSPATFVAGRSGDAAISLGPGSARVLLTPDDLPALQLGAEDSMTVEIDFRTTSNSGVLVGASPSAAGWRIDVLGGKARLYLTDTLGTAAITSTTRVDDGQWHHLVVVRDAAANVLRLKLDNLPAVTATADPTGDLRSIASVMVGAFGDGSSQLVVAIDRLYIKRAATLLS